MSLLKIIAVFAVCMSLYACSRKEPPPPPRIKAELTLELFSAIGEKDFRDALPKIERLKELEPDNVFLVALQNLLRNNIYIEEAQKDVDDGNLKKALSSIEEGIVKYGLQPQLTEAKKQILILITIRRLIKNIKISKTSFQLAKNAVKLKRIIQKYPPAKSLTRFVNESIKRARKLNKKEKEMTIFGIASDIVALLERDDLNATVLMAELEAIQPDNPLVKNFYSFLCGETDAIQIDFINNLKQRKKL